MPRRGLDQDSAKRVAQPVRKRRVETKAIRYRSHSTGAVPVPVLGDLNGVRLMPSLGRRKITAEAIAAEIRCDADLVISYAVFCLNKKEETCVIDEKLPHTIAGVIENQAARPAPVSKEE